MSKYIIEIEEKPLCVFDKDTQTYFPRLWRVKGFNSLVFDEDGLSRLEELNSDYINENFGELQDDAYNKGYAQCQDDYGDALKHAKDTAYQKGLEDGKAVNDKGCEGCKYANVAGTHEPCVRCSNSYGNQWTAKDDRIEVGDELEHTVSGYTSKAIFLEKIVDDEDWYKCLFWTGCGVAILSYPKSQFKRTGKHYGIDKILEEMRYDN